jgi:hypothetical protein
VTNRLRVGRAECEDLRWTEIKDPAEARGCGPELINLLRQLPALDRRHLTSAQQRLEYLQNAPIGR